MLHLHRNKIVKFSILIFLWICSVPGVQAQNKFYVRQNLSNHDDKSMHYGFYLGVNSSRFTLEHSDFYVQQPLRINPKFSPGFNIGFVLNKRITDYVDARFVPGVGFYSRKIEFTDGNEPTMQEIGATSLEFPLLFKFKSKRRGNIRMYFVGGAKASTDVGNKKRNSLSEEGRIEVNGTDAAIEYGVGLDLFYPYFKFAPEIRFSNGLINRYIPGTNQNLQGMRSNTITLYLNFEN
ncbi:porin family protein [Adhaeribacter aquaticus]|uniref:type IX secretion/gliding motility protein PorT/SprT n=1 Tax=Adhaeribacter aquaticus TaxID=299567 RepID=UPI000683FEAB|nr:porin family protein [Adhaeribacter aquaticus]